MTLPNTDKAGLPYTVSEFRRKVNWLVQKVDERTDKLFQRKLTDVNKAEGTRRCAFQRWEQSMLCRPKEYLYGRTPHIFDRRFRELRKRIDQFPLMTHSSLVSRYFSEVQRMGQEMQTYLTLSSLLLSCQRVKDIFPGEVSRETAKSKKSESLPHHTHWQAGAEPRVKSGHPAQAQEDSSGKLAALLTAEHLSGRRKTMSPYNPQPRPPVLGEVNLIGI